MNAYSADNAASRAQLAGFTARLMDEDLRHPMEAGWTAAAVLAHVAFWDLRALALLRLWKAEGIGPSPVDTHVVNEAARGLCVAIAPRAAVELMLSAAEAIDLAIDALEPAFLADVEMKGQTVRLDRADHRRRHMAEIEQVLGKGG